MLDRVPYFFLILGASFAGLSIIGLSLIFEKKTDHESSVLIINDEEKLEENIEKQKEEVATAENDEIKGTVEIMPVLKLRDALKIPDLYLISFVMCFGGTSLGIFTNNYKVRFTKSEF